MRSAAVDATASTESVNVTRSSLATSASEFTVFATLSRPGDHVAVRIALQMVWQYHHGIDLKGMARPNVTQCLSQFVNTIYQ